VQHCLVGSEMCIRDRNRAVIAVDDSLLLSFGPRTPDLLRQLSDAIGEVSGR
jgi:ABC-type hemin transport system substrate-binding protein